MEEVVKKCPFCGSKPIYVVDRVEGIYIFCWKCEVRTPGYFDSRPISAPNAITKVRNVWNARAEIGEVKPNEKT